MKVIFNTLDNRKLFVETIEKRLKDITAAGFQALLNLKDSFEILLTSD